MEELEKEWDYLLERTIDKGQKLNEASRQQRFNTSVRDFEFWLSEVRSLGKHRVGFPLVWEVCHHLEVQLIGTIILHGLVWQGCEKLYVLVGDEDSCMLPSGNLGP